MKKINKPKSHSFFERQGESNSGAPVISLSGYIGVSEAGVIRLHPSLSQDEFLEIPEASVVDTAENADLGVTTVRVRADAFVFVVSRRLFPLVGLLLPTPHCDAKVDNPPIGGGGGVSQCVQARIDKCKTDPMTKDPSVCTRPDMINTFKVLCDMLGSPTGGGPVVAS